MKIEIEPENDSIRLIGKGDRSLKIHFYEKDGADIISFGLGNGHTIVFGKLPDVEFTVRDTLLRDHGKITQVS